MVFSTSVPGVLLIVVILLWLSVLTVLVLRAISHYNRLSEGVTKQGLSAALEAILRTVTVVRTKAERTEQGVSVLEEDAKQYIQRIGIVRFNPFADTGGAQSFAIALLDKDQNGIVMTSLYGRSGNRWYIKEVISGKGKDLGLSKEEEHAILKAAGKERAAL